MASVRKKTRVQKKRSTKTNKASDKFKIRVGKIGDYQKAVNLKLQDAFDFRELVQETLTGYATILDSSDAADLGDARETLVTVCGTIFSDIQRFDAQIAVAYDEVQEYLKATTVNPFEMHIEALRLITTIESLVDEHTQLFMLNATEIKNIDLMPEEVK